MSKTWRASRANHVVPVVSGFGLEIEESQKTLLYRTREEKAMPD
jgi:hypothetical protein